MALSAKNFDSSVFFGLKLAVKSVELLSFLAIFVFTRDSRMLRAS